MFLRSTAKKVKGKTYRYWKLVENVRTERGVRQRVVAHLGDLASFRAEDWQALAERMGEPEMARVLEAQVEKGGKRGRPRRTVLELYAQSQPEDVSIRLSSVHWRKARDFGDVYVGLELWKRLGLGKLLEGLLDAPGAKVSCGGRRSEVPLHLVAALIAVNRLVAPRSEWAILRWWPKTALPALLGLPVGKVSDDRLYRCLDGVWAHKAEIEAHLQGEGKRLFAQDYSLFLYDLTSTYFEGQAASNLKAKRGYSRDHRSDAKQVCLGVVIDREGFPIGMEVWRGNIQDHETLSATLKKLEERFGRPQEGGQRVLCLDRGMVSQEKLEELRDQGYGYVVADRRSQAHRYWEKINPSKWQVIRQSREGEPLVEVTEVGREGPDRLVLVRSRGCREKERAIHDRFLARLTEGLERLAKGVAQGRIKDPSKIERRIGRLQERYPGVSRWVHIGLQQQEGGPRLHWCVKPSSEEEARQGEGLYLLRTNLLKAPTQEVWENYILLTRIENTFRTLKHDLNLRPIFHQKEERVEAHLFFSFLAYALMWTLERGHRARGGQLSGRRLLEVLHEIKLGTIGMITSQGQPLTLERISIPSREQAEILATLHITLPRPYTRLEPVSLTTP